MGHQRLWVDDGSIDQAYYPSPVSRKMPSWTFWLTLGLMKNKEEGALGALLMEIFQAVDGGQYRLAAMGIRALLEQVMIFKIGDLPTFDKKLDEFQKQGYISLIQRDSMRATLDVGDAAMHRGFRPTEQELSIALDVVEGVLLRKLSPNYRLGLIWWLVADEQNKGDGRHVKYFEGNRSAHWRSLDMNLFDGL